MKNILLFIAFLLSFFCAASFAGEADVIKVDVKKSKNNVYDFTVTVAHKDTGWKHYANKWEVTGEDGVVFGTRTLYHPHVNEQPFTRQLSGVEISADVKSVTVRAHDLVHEYGGKVITVELQ